MGGGRKGEGGLSTVVPQAIINPTTPATERVECGRGRGARTPFSDRQTVVQEGTLCVSSLHATRRVSELRVCNFKFLIFFFIFTPVGQVKAAKIFPHDLIRIPSVAVESRGATVTLESTCHKR